MNLIPEATELPPPSPGEVATPEAKPTGSKHPPLKVIGIAVAVLVGVGVLGAIGSRNDDDKTTVSAAAGGSQGTGDATVDEQIVDAVWAGDSGKTALCPSFNDLKVSMPNLSEDEIFDMGLRLSDLSSMMAPGQIDHLHELVVNEC